MLALFEAVRSEALPRACSDAPAPQAPKADTVRLWLSSPAVRGRLEALLSEVS